MVFPPFVVADGRPFTPGFGGSVLLGITRHSVVTLARDLGYAIEGRRIPREMLYAADVVFLTGTAAEITPVRRVDRIPVWDGRIGRVTQALQRRFFGLFDGSEADWHGWLSGVIETR